MLKNFTLRAYRLDLDFHTILKWFGSNSGPDTCAVLRTLIPYKYELTMNIGNILRLTRRQPAHPSH
jgi:hypothetical protein